MDLRDAKIGKQLAERAEDRRCPRHQHSTNAKIASLNPGGDTPCTTERHQRKVAWIVSLRDGDVTDTVRKIVVDDPEDAEGRLVERHAEGFGDALADRFGG